MTQDRKILATHTVDYGSRLDRALVAEVVWDAILARHIVETTPLPSKQS